MIYFDDYIGTLQGEIKGLIAEENTYKEVEIKNTSLVLGSLAKKYDITQMRLWKPFERNPVIISVIVDLVLYDIFSRISPRAIPQLRIDRMAAANELLRKIMLPDDNVECIFLENVPLNPTLSNSNQTFRSEIITKRYKNDI